MGGFGCKVRLRRLLSTDPPVQRQGPRTATQQGGSPFPSHREGTDLRAKPAAECRQLVLFGTFPSSSFGKHIAHHQTPCSGLAVIDSDLSASENRVRTGLRNSPI